MGLDCVVRTVFSDQKNLVVTLLFPIFAAENRLSNEKNEKDFLLAIDADASCNTGAGGHGDLAHSCRNTEKRQPVPYGL